MKISITIDVEKDTGTLNSIFGLEEGFPLILDLLEKYKLKATLFISTEILDYLIENKLFDRILKAGHEIASHGHEHIDYRELNEEEIKDKILYSKKLLENLCKCEVIGFRAPQFRIDEKVIEVLKKLGFKYDSSIPDPGSFSAARVLRNVNFSKNFVKKIEDQNFTEFIIDSIPLIKIPHGIFWINLIGYNIYKFLFKFFKKDHIVFFMHPFDIVKDKKRAHFEEFLAKILYPYKDKNVDELFEKLLKFWKINNVKFITLKEAYERKKGV